MPGLVKIIISVVPVLQLFLGQLLTGQRGKWSQNTYELICHVWLTLSPTGEWEWNIFLIVGFFWRVVKQILLVRNNKNGAKRHIRPLSVALLS